MDLVSHLATVKLACRYVFVKSACQKEPTKPRQKTGRKTGLQKRLVSAGSDPACSTVSKDPYSATLPDMASSMASKPQRVAVYLRVSTDDQHAENQLLHLREFCERWEGHELVGEYVDRESGTRGRRERKDFDRMFSDAARRRFDVLLFWALDRFSREGIRKTIAYLQRLDDCGVAFKSYTKPFLDTDNELIAHIVLGVSSYYAQQEALRISERTKAGLERARKDGKVLGRPDGFERWAPVLAGMKEQGSSQGMMSRQTGLSYNTVKKYLVRMETEPRRKPRCSERSKQS